MKTPLRCYDCRQIIEGEVVWLGEVYDGTPKEWPFHPTCADQPWPLYETRREMADKAAVQGTNGDRA